MNDERDPGGAVPATPPPAADPVTPAPATPPRPAASASPVPGPVEGPTSATPVPGPVGGPTSATPVPGPVDGTATTHPASRPKNRVLGITTFVLALLLLAGHIVGIVLANTPSTAVVSTGIAYVVVFGSLVTFLMGAVAAVANLGRAWGFAAMAVSFVANPFVMLSLLGLLSGGAA